MSKKFDQMLETAKAYGQGKSGGDPYRPSATSPGGGSKTYRPSATLPKR